MIKGKDVRDLRKRLGLKQTELANELDVHPNTVRMCELTPDREATDRFQEWYEHKAESTKATEE